MIHPASVGQQVLAAVFLTSVDWAPLCPTLISWLSSPGTFCWLCPSLLLSHTGCPLLLPSAECLLLCDFPSLVFRSRGRSRAQVLCVGFAPKQIKEFSDWHPHTPTQRMPNIVSQLYSQRFGWYVLRPSSGVSCRTQEPTRDFEPGPLFNPRGSVVLIPLTTTRC